MKKHEFKINKKLIVAGGFSGAIALGLAAKYNAFSHLILFAPIFDFLVQNSEKDEEDYLKLVKHVKRAYNNCYRIEFTNIIEKLSKFKELNPDYYLANLDLPILVIHDPNDKNVSIKHVKEKLEQLKKATYLEHYLGHGIKDEILRAFWPDIDKFIKINYLENENKGQVHEELALV